jgi:serine/threonine protein kinase
MNAGPSLHPTDQTLSSFGLGKLDDTSTEAISQHLEECADCRKRVAEMSADSFLGRIQAAKTTNKAMLAQSMPSGGGETGPNSPPAAKTLPPGLADHPDYDIKQELGRGGMGIVYLAHNKMMGRDEVLKLMSGHIMERPGVVDRFLREVRAVATLRHPNIVTAYSIVRIGDVLTFAMEYVEGLDLARMVEARGPLRIADARNYVYQAALGLQHAHEKGMVHRDIKPANLMVSPIGGGATIKILDFGLAKLTLDPKSPPALTSEGQALGTPDFIAPEQIVNAQTADIRADIYSLGATLYYLLAGRPPFAADSLYDMYQAHISREADPLNLVRPDVPAELAALVAKMMAKDPAHRFQTPAEVAAALAPCFRNGSDNGTHRKELQPASAQSRRLPSASWAVLACAACLALIALGIIVITIKYKDRVVRITALDDRPIQIERDGVVVAVDSSKANSDKQGADARGETAGSPAPMSPTVQGSRARIGDLRETRRSPPTPPTPPSARTQAILKVLEKPLSMSLQGETPLEEVLIYIKQATYADYHDPGIQIYIDPIALQEAKKSRKSPIKIEIEGKPLSTTLPLMLDQLGLAYCVNDDVLFISSPKGVERERKRVAILAIDETADTKAAMDVLEKPISMSFADGTSLENILLYIKSQIGSEKGPGIQFYVDPIGLQEAHSSMDSTVLIDLDGVPLKTTLRHMLRQLGLACVVKKGVVHITSTERVQIELRGR